MTQLGETVGFGAPGGDLECPFDHKKATLKQLTNVMPRWEKNDADALGTALGNDHLKPHDIKVGGADLEAHYTPHHLLPGNASWPNTALRKWVDKRLGHIKENIGYDVNAEYNGVSLPGSKGYKAVSGKAWSAYGQQADYAFAAIKATKDRRQFHDAHPAYNEFVTKVLDKISEKLDAKIRNGGSPGCGKTDCAGDTTMKKKYDPPIRLMARLAGVTERLEGYLVGQPSGWKMPIYTSRFSLMYQTKWTEEKARQEMSAAEAIAGTF
jgi:hypothetical protein